MRRRFPKRVLVGIGLVTAIAIGLIVAPDMRSDGSGASPVALNRIAQKNARAADSASAEMIAKSRAAAAAADALRSAQEAEAARDDARLARLEGESVNTASQ